MTIEKLKSAVYDRMVLIETYQDKVKALVSEIQQLNIQIRETSETITEESKKEDKKRA